MRFGGRIVERLPLDAVLVRVHEKFKNLLRDLRRHGSGFHFGRHLLSSLFERLTPSNSLQRSLENLFGGFAIAAAPFAVKVHGIAVKRHKRSSARYGRGRRKIFLSHILIAEFLFRSHFPQKARINLRGLFGCRRQKLGCRGI